MRLAMFFAQPNPTLVKGISMIVAVSCIGRGCGCSSDLVQRKLRRDLIPMFVYLCGPALLMRHVGRTEVTRQFFWFENFPTYYCCLCYKYYYDTVVLYCTTVLSVSVNQ